MFYEKRYENEFVYLFLYLGNDFECYNSIIIKF